MTEKYLYFRSDATLTDDNDASGSILYPVSSLKGMCSGTVDARGVITAGNSVLHLAFQPQAIPTGV